MNNRLKDRVAIVTGSGQGVGRAIAVAMAKEDAKVVTNNRKPGTTGGDADTTAKQIKAMGGDAVPFFGDISNFDEARRLIQTAVNSFGRVDILVNNAGTATEKLVWDITEEEWDRVINFCLKSTFNCTHHASGLMVQQRWGRIINTTSIAWLGTRERCHYAAAKAGVVGLTRGVAREVGGYGVTCNVYAPGAATRMTVGAEYTALYKRRYESGFYTKEQYEAVMNMPRAEAVTPFLIYLCTEEAADINGQVFDVRGGTIAIYSEPAKKKAISKENGLWSIDELIKQVPKVLLEGYKNPAPAQLTR